MLLTILYSLNAHAVPLQITQQGRMVDTTGLGVEGVDLVAFRIYDDPAAGNILWEDFLYVSFNNGYYAAVLGSDTQNNPLDSSVLSLYPLYLELQLGGNSPMSPRTEVNSTPYAQIAGIAESVEGGTVDATAISINGNPVIDNGGLWVGPALTVDWTNLTGVPTDIADGDANTQLSETQVEGYVNNGAIDLHPSTTMNNSGLLTQADVLTPDWTNVTNRPAGLDDGDDDTVLNESEVEAYIINDGIDLNPATTLNGSAILTQADTLTPDWANVTNRPAGLDDGDDDTVLNESEVEAYIVNDGIDLNPATTLNGNAILTQADVLTPDWTNVTNRPTGLDDGDDDTLADLGCTQGEIVGWDGLNWVCTSDGRLSESEVEAYVTNGGIDLDASSTIAGQDFLTSTDETLSRLNCIDGEIARWDGVTGEWYCIDYVMGGLNCSDGEITSYDGAQGIWVCTNIQTLFDNDGDGIVAWADCDDNDPNQLSNTNDNDCDGTVTSDDCNDNDANSLTVSDDGDCDGVLTADDCDDGDANLLAQNNDNDCDGTLATDDCNDNDANSTTVATDADCDGFLTADDCNDNDNAINPNATEVSDGVDNDCDGMVDNTIAYNMDNGFYVSVDTYQGDFNAGGGFCTQMVGQTAYLVSFGYSLSSTYSAGIWQGNSSSSASGYNCSLYSSNSSSHSGYGGQGGYGACSQSRHVVCSTNTTHCHSNNCSLWD